MFEISKFMASDEEQWRVLWAGYQADEQASQEKIDREVQANWPKILNGKECYSFALRDIETQVAVGFAIFVVYCRVTMRNDHCYLSDLFVMPNHQGKGGGRLLIDSVIKFAKESDLCAVSWITQKDNKQAQILYDKFSEGVEWIRYKIEL